MNLARFDAICQCLPATRLVIQWGESHVYKIGEKMFALSNLDSGVPYYVFKTTPLSFEILLEQKLAARAPYLPRGNWVKISGAKTIPESDLAAYLAQSHKIIAASLTKATRQRLGL